MPTRMSAEAYVQAWRAAGRLTVPPRPRPHLLTRGIPVGLPIQRNAVYVACVDRVVRYVGSTTRGVAARVREHVRDRNRAAWEELWVIGLVDDATPYGVLLAEERVGLVLDPVDNIREPGR